MLILASALFGASVPSVSKIALEVVSPVGALFFRALLSTILFALYFSIIRRPYSMNTLQRTWKYSLLLVFNFAAALIALGYIPTALIPVVYATIPLITLLLNKLINKTEVISPLRIVGILVGFLGVFLATVSRGFASINSDVIFGVMWILAGSVSFSLYTILSKKHQRNTDPLHLIFSSTILAACITLPFVISDYISHPYLLDITWVHFLALVVTAVIGTVLFYSVYQYSIKHSDSVTVSLFTYIQPIFAILLSILLLGETVNAIFVLGTAITLTGAYLASR